NLYVSVAKADGTFELVEVSPTTTAVLKTVTTQDGGLVGSSGGSVWVAMSDPTGYGRCSLARFEPGSLTVQAAIPIGCDISGPMFVATDDGIWWKDRPG